MAENVCIILYILYNICFIEVFFLNYVNALIAVLFHPEISGVK